MKRITVFEITLTGIILSVAITAKYFDNFIPHVHPLHVVVLGIGIAVMRFVTSSILVGSYIGLKFIIFGIKEITAFMLAMHILQVLSLLIIASIKLVKTKNRYIKVSSLVSIIIFTMVVFLTFMIIGDSDYSPKSVDFAERVRLALIWPGDWMNVVITTSIMIVTIPPTYFVFNELLESKLQHRIF